MKRQQEVKPSRIGAHCNGNARPWFGHILSTKVVFKTFQPDGNLLLVANGSGGVPAHSFPSDGVDILLNSRRRSICKYNNQAFYVNESAIGDTHLQGKHK